MQDDLFPDIAKKQGQIIKAWCCEKELDCTLKIFKDGTRHAWGTCPICGKTNAKSQRLSPSLEALGNRLGWIRSMIISMDNGEDKDEAVAMLERFTEEMGKEI